MEECSLPKVRPISCNVCPAFQRRHTSLFCAAESPNRFPALINTTFENSFIQMVLHRPSEPARLPDIENSAAALSHAPKAESDMASRREAANHEAQTQERACPAENKARPSRFGARQARCDRKLEVVRIAA